MATKVKPSRLQVSGTPQAGDVPVYVDEDCFQWCAGGGGGGGCAMWGCITGTLCNQTDLQGALDCKLNASALSNAAYGSGWDGDSTHTATKDAIYDKIRTVDTALAGKANDIAVVKLTCNQLIDGIKTFCISPVVPSKCAAAVNCDTAIATEAQVYNVAQAIPTDNCQLANGCGYTTCTGTVSTCADIVSALGYTPYSTGNPCNYINNFAGVVSALGYTPYNTTNPCGYTTCTGTLTSSDLACYACCCDIPTDNCQLSNGCGYTTCTGTLTSSDISDAALSASWDGDTTHAPSKNAVYDAIGDIETLLAAL